MEQNKIWESFNLKTEKQNPRCLAVNTVLAGKYLVGPALGEGGFGITYAGYDLNMETRIAIKEYFPVELVSRDTTRRTTEEGGAVSGTSASGGGSDRVISLSGEKSKTYRQGLKKYVDEARNVSRFSGIPGIVSVKDFFYENDTAYIVMEYIEGVSLKEYLKQKGGKVSEEEALAILHPVLEALEKVHAAEIVHRDISPDNIMLTFAEQGNISAVKLIDFGAARMTTKNDQKSLTIILKHGYAPEEQYRSHGEQGPWTDVYALCAVFYRMITGKVPEPAMDRLFSDSLKRPEELGSKVSPAVSEAIMRGLAVKKEDRIRSVRELMDALYAGKKLKKNRNGKLSRPVLTAALAACALIAVFAAAGIAGAIRTGRGPAGTDNVEEAVAVTEQEKETLNASRQGMETDAGHTEGEETLVFQEEAIGEQIVFSKPWTAVSSSSSYRSGHTLFRMPDGSVKALGSNTYGQCMVSDWKNVEAVAAGSTHSLGLRSDGKVYAAGQNDDGQCETGAWEDIVAIAAGNRVSFGLRSDGTVLACGQAEKYADEISGWKDIQTIAIPCNSRLIGLDGDGVLHFAGAAGTEMPEISGWNDVVWIGSDTDISADLIGLRKDGTVIRTSPTDEEGNFKGIEDWDDISQISRALPLYAVKTDGTAIVLGGGVRDTEEVLEEWTGLEAITSAYGWGLIYGLFQDGTIRECRPNFGNAELADMKDLKWVQVTMTPSEGGIFAVTKDGRALLYGVYTGLMRPERMEYMGIVPSSLKTLVGEGYLCEDGTLYGTEMTGNADVWTEKGVRQAIKLWNDSYAGAEAEAYAMLTEEGKIRLRLVGDSLENTGTEPETFWNQARSAESWTNVVQILGAKGVLYGLHGDGTISTTAEENQEKLEGISGVKKIAGYAGEGSNLEDVLALMDNGTVKPLVTSAYAAEFGRTQTESWSDVADIAVGESHVVGLLSDGTVIAAGSNHAGQCDVEDWENIIYLTTGRNCTLGITTDGDLMMAGSLY